MLNRLDIALLCDSRTVDGAGLAITPDRSRHGIHAQLGDGTTAATMPTLDALNGRYTFDGNDYMRILSASDVSGVIAGMGSLREETYLFYFDPFINSIGNLIYFFFREVGAGGENLYLRKNAVEKFQLVVNDGVNPNELVQTGAIATDLNGKSFIMVFTRRPTDQQEVFVDAVSVATGVTTSRDGSAAARDVFISGYNTTPSSPLIAGTGLRFFGYARKAFTALELRAIQRYLRGNL